MEDPLLKMEARLCSGTEGCLSAYLSTRRDVDETPTPPRTSRRQRSGKRDERGSVGGT